MLELIFGNSCTAGWKQMANSRAKPSIDNTKEQTSPGFLRGWADKFGNQLIDAFVLTALFVLGGTIVWSAVYAYFDMMSQTHGSIADILLIFIYLELGAMVGMYFKSGRIPAQFLLYVAITVLTRLLTSAGVVDMSDFHILSIVSAILILCIAVFVLRYTEARFGPTKKDYWLS